MADKKIALGEVFRNRRERSRVNLPILSVTMSSGLVRRDTLDRKNDTNLECDEHLLVRTGDIAYNTMRMWQGVSALSEHEGIVSPAYTVCIPGSKIDGRFAAYMFKYRPVVNQLFRYSQGLVDDTRNLKFRHFAEVPVAIPTLATQRRVSEVLNAVDRDTVLLERYRNTLHCQRIALMQGLLSMPIADSR